MKRSFRNFLIFLVAFITIDTDLPSQNSDLDSLLTLLKTDKEDSNKVIHFNKVCDELQKRGEFTQGLAYVQEAKILASDV